MPRPRPPHLHREESRHGSVVWYVRKGHGARIRLKAEYGTPSFWSEYRAALEGAPMPANWALHRYRNSSAWAALANATRRQRENVFSAVVTTAGTVPLNDITADIIRAGRERRASTPHAA